MASKVTAGGKSSSSKVSTLTDVARLAGVSVSTASKALNGRRQVKAETRARVIAAAERLAFTPNALAAGLLAGRTGTVGLITSDLEGRFSLPILMGAEDAFGSGKTSVFLCDARHDPEREQAHVRALLSRRVDGLIVVGDRTDPRPSLGRDLPVPVVYAYAPSQDARDLSFVTDNVGGGRMAVEHLLADGRTRIAHISGDPTYGAAQERATGCLSALAAAQLPLRGGHVLFGHWSEAWGRAATRRLLEQEPDVDAIFAGSDQIARGVLDVLHDEGRDVPGDVAVVGFDNWDVMAEHARPPLSSVDPNLTDLGAVVAKELFAAIDGHQRSGVERLPCRIQARASTGPKT